jgi:hypothetical protein
MDEQRERVLIGDPNPRRVELFDVETATSQHFDEVKKLAINSFWNVILIATNLPLTSRMGANFKLCFEALPHIAPKKSKLVCIFGEDDDPNFSVKPSRWIPFSVPPIGRGGEARRKIIGQFRSQQLSWSPRWPEVTLEKNDLLLHEQVRSLTGSRKLDAGKSLLAQLVRGFFIC